MRGGAYRAGYNKPKRRGKLRGVLVVVMILLAAFGAWTFVAKPVVEKITHQLIFDTSVSQAEQEIIRSAIETQQLSYSGDVTISVHTTFDASGPVFETYVPVTGFYNATESITEVQLAEQIASLPQTGALPEADSVEVSLISLAELNDRVKLLEINDEYYLDSFSGGAVYRQLSFSGGDSQALGNLNFSDKIYSDNEVLTLKQTGVTALTRQMMNKLRAAGGDATYFSQYIGDFLADADITHVSNEVSFQTGCQIGDMLFCAPPAMIETLKDSGVDVVELTGNHNNDLGAQYNTETINLYHSLGWGTFGGGLNSTEAAKPWFSEQKGSKLALLGYNYPDSPNGGAIAGTTRAGANSFDFNKIESDIASAKAQGSFVIVDVQFWECFAYPDGYVEFPECDGPIPNQAEVFRQIVDLGADMVVGSSAHQPQTFELYKDKPIYYGLGNLYFDQYRWPGTERGLVLTHYLRGGKLLQTKITPTVYDSAMQTRVMTSDETQYLFERLNAAR